MKTKPILSHFGGSFGTLKFTTKSFFNTVLGFTPYWDHKPTDAFHADSPGIYTSEKFKKLSTIDKIHLKCNVIEGSVVSCSRQPILEGFVSDKPHGCKVFCQTETIYHKKINKSVLKTITFY